MAFYLTGAFQRTLFLTIHLFGLLVQLYIVYANDYADLQVDLENRTHTIFSGGSRVLVEGLIAPREIGIAILLSAGSTLGVAWALSYTLGRNLAPAFAIISLALLWAYSYPPLQLSYRGGGEILQALGLTVVLPAFSYYVQAGDLGGFPYSVPLILFPINLGVAFSTTLPDYPADLRGGKRTLAVIVRPKTLKRIIPALNALTCLLVMISPVFHGAWQWYAMIPPLAITAAMLAFMRDAVPGQRAMTYFVGLNIASLLCLVSVLTLYFFVGG